MTKELQELLEAQGYILLREIEGRGICGVYRFVFTIGIVWGINETEYRGRWCYDSLMEAVVGLEEWDGKGDPKYGWIKYKGEGGERRNPKKVQEV